MEKIVCIIRGPRVGSSLAKFWLRSSGACLAAMACLLALVATAEGATAKGRPVRRPSMRAERRAARPLAVPSRAVAPATNALPQQSDSRQVASPPAGKAPLPAAAPSAAAKAPSVVGPAKGPATAKGTATPSLPREFGVQRAAFESAAPNADGTVSVLVRPEAAAPANLEPLTFPAPDGVQPPPQSGP